MKLVAWNIMKGGAKRAAAITALLEKHMADVVILTEIRPSSASMLRGLSDRGWCHQLVAIEENPIASVAVVSRYPIVRLPPAEPAALLPGRWLEGRIEHFGVTVAGAYGPLRREPYDRFWTAVSQLATSRARESYILAGDLNTGESLLDAPSARFFCSDHFCGLRTTGMVDVWRSRNSGAREFSYHHRLRGGQRGAGFRIDHVLMTPDLAGRVTDCGYDRTVLDAGTSDHALVYAHVALR